MELDRIPASWRTHLRGELDLPYFAALRSFLVKERRAHQVYPPEREVFTAFELTPFARVRVVILGQDPYHGPGQAHGLAFSVRPPVRPPPSLVNMLKELRDDLGCAIPPHGDLTAWARQGVLLLNPVLTVREGTPNSHRNRGWERFTDAALRALNARAEPLVFILWGAHAQKKAALIDETRHVVLRSAHPSPLAARRGFFGSRPFSAANRALQGWGAEPIDWCLPAEPATA